jgi:DNA-binding NarL/FixJ family response regulator
MRLSDDQVVMPARLARALLLRAGNPAIAAPPAPASPGTAPAAHPVRHSGRVRHDPLTPREREALTLLAEGLMNKQIARQLRISDHGAKRLVASVLVKLSSPNRTLAVVTALREGLLDPPR